MYQDKKWHKLESGQALMEYWPTIPAAIMIIISAGLIVNFLRGSFSQTSDVLNRVNLEVCETNEDETQGPVSVVVDRHDISFVSAVYDPETNTTTVTYQVTSDPSPDLSHWVLGIPKEIADLITDSSEKWSWTDGDPATGAVGIKFDTGYGDGGGEGAGGEGAGGKGKGKGKMTPITRYIPNIYLLLATGETREISLTLDGEFTFEPTVVTTKSGSDSVGTGELPAPTLVVIDLGTTSEGCE